MLRWPAVEMPVPDWPAGPKCEPFWRPDSKRPAERSTGRERRIKSAGDILIDMQDVSRRKAFNVQRLRYRPVS